MHVRTDFSQQAAEWDAIETRWMAALAAGGPAARDALGNLFRVYGKLFERRLRRMGMQDQADDIAQGVWLEIARAAPRYRGEMPVRAFLVGFLKMARTRFFSDLKRQQARQQAFDDEVHGQDDESVAPPLSTSIAISKSGPEWRDFERCVGNALARFERRHPAMARLLLLRHVEEWSLDEMARELGGSATRAKAEVYAARRKMAPLIEECLNLWPDRARSPR